MIQQALDFIDGRILGGMYNLYIRESRTYPLDFSIRNADGSYTIVFTGSVFIEAGNTHYSLDISDLLRYNRWIPKVSDITSASTGISSQRVNLIGLCRWRILDSSGTYKSQYTSYGNIYRYPDRNSDLEFMVVDPNYVSNKIIGNMVQGCKDTWTDRGRVSSVTGYSLIPRIPIMQDGSAVIPLTVQSYCPQGTLLHQLRIADSQGSTWRSYSFTADEGANSYFITIKATSAVPSKLQMYDDTTNRWVDTAIIEEGGCNRQYLMWQDRWGGFQSQPFEKGRTYKEDFTYYTTLDYDNTKRMLQTDVASSVEINTGWIDESMYPIYESIFVSPFLLLKDTETGLTSEVIVKDRSYTEKTFKNQDRKMFNLKLNLEMAHTQSITF